MMAEAEKSGLLPKSNWQVLVLAVALGLIGVGLMAYYLHSKDRKKETVSVAVATQQIAAGDTIKHGMMVKEELPKGTIRGNFVSGNDVVSVEGRVVGVDMDPGQPLYWNAIPLASQGGYDRYLRPELRERAFAITLSGALGSAASPGDVIDILGTYTEGGQLQAFEVLPAVTVIGKVGATLVLNVTPDEELLLLAAQPCNLTLSIRSKEEPETDTKLDPVRLTDVLPKSKELGAARTARLREAAATPQASIHRD